MAGNGNQYQPPIISDQYANVSALLAPAEQTVWNAFMAMLTAVTEVLGELNQDQYLMILDVAAHLAVTAGEVPYIGSNGNWWLGGTDSGVSANGLPGPQGPQGATGPQGQSFKVLGSYANLAALQAAHPTGNPGDAYAVGAAGSQTVYIWDPATSSWVNIGPITAGIPYVNTTPPPSPAVGDLWFDTVGLQMYIWYNDGTSIQWAPVINQGITTGGGGGGTAGVTSWNTRTGDVVLAAADVTGVGGAMLAGPAFTGVPTAPTAAANTSTTQLATTAFVTSAITALPANVSSFNTRTGAVTFTTADLTAVGGVTGGPYALIASPALTGTPTAPTAAAATNTTQLATTAFVQAAITAISAGVVSFNGRSGAVTLTTADITAAGAVTGGPYAIQTNPAGGQNNYAPLAGPTFTGVVTLPTGTVGVTQTAGTNNTSLATTAYVTSAIAALPPAGAVINPTAPASPNVGELWFDSTGLQTYVWYNDGNSTQWVPVINQGVLSGSFAPLTNPASGQNNYAPLANPTFTGTVTIPAGASISGFAPLASPAFTGTPTVGGSNVLTASSVTSTAIAGDVTGTLAASTVARLQGRTMASTAPTTNQVLAWSGSQWAPATPSGGGLPVNNPAFTGIMSFGGTTGSTGPMQLQLSPTASQWIGGTSPFPGAMNSQFVIGPVTTFGTAQANGAAGGLWGTGGGIVLSGNAVTSFGSWFATSTNTPVTASLVCVNITQNGGAGPGIFLYADTGITTSSNYIPTLVTQFTNTSPYAYKPSGGSWGATSDIRVKRDIGVYTRGLEAVLQLRPITYYYNGKGGTPDDGVQYVGLVADDVESIMPEMVGEHADLHSAAGDKLEHLKTLDVSALTYALVNAVKELNTRLTKLEN